MFAKQVPRISEKTEKVLEEKKAALEEKNALLARQLKEASAEGERDTWHT